MKKLLMTFGLVLFFVSCGGGGGPTPVSQENMVVGQANYDQNPGQYAFYWTPTEGAVDIGTSYIAKAANENGIIVGAEFNTVSGDDFSLAYWEEGTGWTNVGQVDGWRDTWAVDINENGMIVGYTSQGLIPWYYEISNPSAGFVIIPHAAGQFWSQAEGVNDYGVIVGWSGTGPYDSWYYDTAASNPTTTVIDKLPLATWAMAKDINNQGTIVGYGDGGGAFGNLTVGWYWQNATTGAVDIDFPLNGNDSRALAINDAGTIVGNSNSGTGVFGWYWDPITIGYYNLLPTLPGHEASYPFAISNNGMIVGNSDDGTEEHVFWWTAADGINSITLAGATFSEGNAAGLK
ncbi:hypothetical protein CL659_00725 [bacterium]|nr:hypothetical protein [bacterium]|tara:strand:- start:870 stop:1910 length:1041 start_codon:yes stop_codon:yes gene_type:complete